jgi:hypothetical protein
MCALNIDWLSDSNGVQGQALSLLKELLGAMQTLRGQAASPAQDWFDALRTVSNAIKDNKQPSALSTKDWLALKAEWAELEKGLGEQLPTALRPLANTLAELSAKTVAPATLPGMLLYPLAKTEVSTKGIAPASGLGFRSGASGQAMASVESSISAPDWARAAGYQLPDADCFFRLGLKGSLAADAAASLSPPWGSIGVSANVSGGAHIDYCFSYAGSWFVARALAHSLEVLPRPGALAAMLDACRDPEFALASMDISGSAELKGELGAERAIVGTLLTPGAKQSWKPVTLGGSVAARFDAHWALKGDYQLIVRNAPGGPIALLDRKLNRSSGAAIDLSMQIGIDGAQAALDPLLAEMLPTAQALITRLGELSDLPALALQSLNEALGIDGSGDWDACASALLELASGHPGASDTLQAALKTRLQSYTQDALAHQTQALQTAASDLAAQIRQAVDVPAPLQAKLDAALNDGLSKLEQRLTGASAKLGQELANTAADQTMALAQLLEVPGSQFAAFCQDLQQFAQPATERLGKWLQSYQALRTRVAQAVGQLQSRKLALDIAYSYQRDEGKATILEVQFIRDSVAASALYQALWSGKLQQYLPLLRRCTTDGSARELRSVFTQDLKRTSTFGFSLNVTDLLSLSANSTAMDQIVVQSNSAGTILAAQNHIALGSNTTVNGAASSTSLDLNLALLTLPNVTPPLDAQFKASGDELTLPQVQQFFDLLEQGQLISSGTTARVADFLFGGAAGTGARVAHAAIQGSYVLDLPAWQRLLTANQDTISAAIRQACLDMLDLAVQQGAERGGMDGTASQWLQDWCQLTGWDSDRFWATASDPAAASFIESVITAASGLGNVATTAGVPTKLRVSLHRLWEVQKIAGSSKRAWAALRQEAALLEDLAQLPQADSEQVYATMADLSHTIKAGLAKAFQFDVPDLRQPIKVSWRFLGLMLGLARVASPEQSLRFFCRVDTVDHGEPQAKLFL